MSVCEHKVSFDTQCHECVKRMVAEAHARGIAEGERKGLYKAERHCFEQRCFSCVSRIRAVIDSIPAAPEPPAIVNTVAFRGVQATSTPPSPTLAESPVNCSHCMGPQCERPHDGDCYCHCDRCDRPCSCDVCGEAPDLYCDGCDDTGCPGGHR